MKNNGKPDGRMLRGARTKERILDEALLLVDEGGLSAVAVKNLAARTGMSAGALYRHFKGVDDVVLALRCRALLSLGMFMAEQQRVVSEALALGTQSERVGSLVRLLSSLSSYRAYAAYAPRQHAMLDGLLTDPERVYPLAVAQDIEGMLAPVLGSVEASFAKARRAGALSLGDDAVRTRVAWGQALGLFHLQKRDRLEPPARQSGRLFDEAVRALLVGWGAAPEEVESAQRAWVDFRGEGEKHAEVL